MGQGVADAELRRRAVAGVRHEVEAFGSAAPGSGLIESEGLLAAVVPGSPQRSVFNSVYYDDPGALAREVAGLEEAYRARGVRAWTVWVPDHDRDSARLLGGRGHLLDGAPRAMALDLADLAAEPPKPDGVDPGPGDASTAAALNDRAYGFDEQGFRAGLGGETAIQWHVAYRGDEPVSCVGTIERDGDCTVSGVATPPEHRGRGTAGWLLSRVLAEARDRGCVSATLRASKAGAPIYERLGFLDLGFVEMWELRR